MELLHLSSKQLVSRRGYGDLFCLITFFEQVYSCKNSFELCSYYPKTLDSFSVKEKCKRNSLVINTSRPRCYDRTPTML